MILPFGCVIFLVLLWVWHHYNVFSLWVQTTLNMRLNGRKTNNNNIDCGQMWYCYVISCFPWTRLNFFEWWNRFVSVLYYCYLFFFLFAFNSHNSNQNIIQFRQSHFQFQFFFFSICRYNDDAVSSSVAHSSFFSFFEWISI